MKRQFLALLWALAAVGALASCGTDSEVPMSPGPLSLPAPLTDSDYSLEQAFQNRRSVRTLSPDASLSLAEVSQLLWAAQGVTRPDEGKRTAPSAGALYPLEVYVVADRVAGLEPGAYRYRPDEHDLVLHAPGLFVPALAETALDQDWIADAAAVFVISGVYERTTVKYSERGERYVHIEAGHAAQNLVLQATALDLGSVTVGAFADGEVSDLLDIPGDEEPLYVLPVGRKR